MLLAGDIGGTKTALAIVSAEAGPMAPLAEQIFPSSDYPNLEALAHAFLAQNALRVEHASFGVAGPVVAGRAQITNLPWVIDEAHLRVALNLSSVYLLNDLQAIAYAVPHLGPHDLYTLNEGEPDPYGNIAVIAPGTGLGEAFLTRDGERYRAYASEGGHADFAPKSALEFALFRYIERQFEHVSYERICSGHGLPHIYHYLKESGYAAEPSWLTQQLSPADDPTPLIVNAALHHAEKPCELCVSTLNIFVSLLGAEAGNLALKVLATGGVYLSGGIPPRILPALEDGRFLQAFRRKGRMSELMNRMPVHVILNPKAALLGAARYGLDREPEKN